MFQKSGVQICICISFWLNLNGNSVYLVHAHSKWNTIFYEVSLSKIHSWGMSMCGEIPPFLTLCQVTRRAPLPGFQSANHANSQQKDELQEGKHQKNGRCFWKLVVLFLLFFFLVMCGEGVAAKNCQKMVRKTRVSSTRDHAYLTNYHPELSKKEDPSFRRLDPCSKMEL